MEANYQLYRKQLSDYKTGTFLHLNSCSSNIYDLSEEYSQIYCGSMFLFLYTKYIMNTNNGMKWQFHYVFQSEIVKEILDNSKTEISNTSLII